MTSAQPTGEAMTPEQPAREAMTAAQLRDVVVDALRSVAPEADAASLGDAARLRDAFDLDSMDFLNVVIALHTALGVDIPEADYAKLQTLGGAVAYLASRLEPRATG